MALNYWESMGYIRVVAMVISVLRALHRSLMVFRNLKILVRDLMKDSVDWRKNMNNNEKDMQKTLRFSERLKLSTKVEDSITKNMIDPHVFGVISALSVLQLLDVDACHKFLKEEGLILRGIFKDEVGVDSI